MSGEWIRCADKMPDCDTTVLIAMYDGGVGVGFLHGGFLDGGRWRYVTGEPMRRADITHWMPMPAPPEKGGAGA